MAGTGASTADTRPFAPFEWMLARRYLGSKRKETFVSVISIISFIGILLGVATLIIVMAVMNGFRTELLDRILGLNGHVIVLPVERPLSDYDAVAKRIDALPNVVHAFPLVEGQALASGEGGGTGVLVRGLRDDDIMRIDAFAGNVERGTLEDFAASEGVAVGTRLAAALGLGLGDQINIVSPNGDVTPFGTAPRVKAYPITATFEMGMAEYDSSVVLMPIEEAQLYFNRDGTVDAIEVFVPDPDRIDADLPSIREAAQRPVRLEDWRARNASFFKALQVERNVMFLILTLIILVAALNIISGLFMLVKDKGRDIAILRTMGATRGSVMRVFLITGAAIGVFGTLAGTVLGIAVAVNIKAIQDALNWLTGSQVWDPTIRFLSDIPARLDAGETMSIVLRGLGLSFLATIFPAWRAARLDPVEALRYE